MANTNTDQMRRLRNSFNFAGPIAEIELKEGKGKESGVENITVTGVIRCGESSIYDMRFRIFSTAKKPDGSVRDNFFKLRNWARNCVPLTKSTENATWAEMSGYLSMNDYVNASGQLKETLQFNANWVGNFSEYKCMITLESVLHTIADEIRGKDEDQQPTGRKRIRLVGNDIYGRAVEMKNVIATEETAELLEEHGFGAGTLSTYYIHPSPTGNEERVVTSGLGKKRVIQGKGYLEFLLDDAQDIITEDSKDFVPNSVFKKLMSERKIHLKEVEEAGYQGNKNGGGSSSGSSTAKKSVPAAEELTDDDMDF